MNKEITTTSLEMTSVDAFIPSQGYEMSMEIKEVKNDPYLNFMLFSGVGIPWRWYSRLLWSLQDWKEYFEKTNTKTFLGFFDGKMVGYFELEFQEEGNTEIKFFGLLPNYVGMGLGGKLLSHAINQAWKMGTNRLWVHTCDLDSDVALNNYQSRGFKIYRQDKEQEDVPDKEELLRLVSNFFNQYLEAYSDTSAR